MKGLLILFMLVGSGFTASRRKRDLFRFDEMITCVTGRLAALDYNGYGCWCGKGGYGDPKDETDQCCKTHDECYKKLENAGTCSSLELYFDSYNCHYCTDGNGEEMTKCSKCPEITVTCDSTNDKCQMALCQCDRDAVNCFKNSEYHDYNKYLINWFNC